MQELEKILEEIDETIERYKENPRLEIVDIRYGLNQAKRIIRKHINDGWIPVEERLPDNNENVLVTTDMGINCVRIYSTWHMDNRSRAGLSYCLAPLSRAVSTEA